MGYLANYSPSPFGEGRGEAISLTLSYPINSIPTSQIQRGISLIVLPLLSERDGERLLPSLSPTLWTAFRLLKHNGVSRFLPPSPFGEGSGERLLRASVQATFLCTIREESVHIAPRSPPINEKRGRASLRDLHRNLVSNYYKIVISKVGFLSFQTLSFSRHSLCLQQREWCCASAESLNSLGIVHHIIDT